jgi:hypothetical protein
MAFTVPVFNLTANIWTFGTHPAPPRVVTVCNLAMRRQVAAVYQGQSFPTDVAASMYLLMPPRTDVRGGYSSTGQDLVEVPAGTGRFYAVLWVDDVGRGFPNEYRLALIQQMAPLATPWP